MEIPLRYQDPSRALSFRLYHLIVNLCSGFFIYFGSFFSFPAQSDCIATVLEITTVSPDPATPRTTGRTADSCNGLISANTLVPCKVSTLSPNYLPMSRHCLYQDKSDKTTHLEVVYKPHFSLLRRPSQASPMGIVKRATPIPSFTWLIYEDFSVHNISFESKIL